MLSNKLLDGFKILDLSQYIPGPFATRLLSDLGATVIKVEPPHGDPMRRFMYQGSESTSRVYRHLNAGKKIVRLDLKTEADKQILNRIIAQADVLLESFRPGVMPRLGYDSDSLKSLNASLVHCALSGFGQNGPYRNQGGHDLTYCAASGLLGAMGIKEKPVMTFPPLADHAGAMQAANAILAALLQRERKGSGCHIDVSLYESALSWQYLLLDESTQQREELLLNGGSASYNIYETADGKFVALAPLEEKFWMTFCQAVDRDDWIARQQEPLPQTALIAEVSELFLSKTLSGWVELLGEKDCCFEPVLLPDETGNHPQTISRSLYSDSAPVAAMWLNGKPVQTAEAPSDVDDKTTLHW